MTKHEDFYEEILSDVHFAIRRWKTLINHMENEIVFLDRLLNSDIISKVNTTTITERLKQFKKRIKTSSDILIDFKLEVAGHAKRLEKATEGECFIEEEQFLERHSELKGRFEKFCFDFKELRARVLLQTGSVL
tara:strand:- start:105 stop:506 length:402 start_codon:yes stop_codon:yes gene_type:complete